MKYVENHSEKATGVWPMSEGLEILKEEIRRQTAEEKEVPEEEILVEVKREDGEIVLRSYHAPDYEL